MESKCSPPLEIIGVNITPRTPHAIVDKAGRIIVTLAGRPDASDWDCVIAEAMLVLGSFRDRGSTQEALFTEADWRHRRGHYLAVSAGVSFGGGQKVNHGLIHARASERLFALGPWEPASLCQASKRASKGLEKQINQKDRGFSEQ